MAQQTAVDWLREQYVHITWMVNRDELPTDTVFEFMLHRFEQAKQLEKEQIENAYIVGSVDELPYNEDAQQYYTKTYGK